MTAPSIKEAFIQVLASLAAAVSILERTPRSKKAVASDTMFDISLNDYRKALEVGRVALATLQPSGERREAIARILAEKWPGDYMQGDDECEREPNALAYETADLILSSGLVQDEAGWRDISTAPKDGTVIDVWLGDADGSDLDFYCQSRTCKRSANWYWSNGKFRPFTGLDLPLTTFVEPTHWIPLPAPPIRSARNGGAET